MQNETRSCPCAKEHAEIWLSPPCDSESNDGRLWAPDNPFDPCPECGAEAVRFVRADLVAGGKPCDQDALTDAIAGAVDPANFYMRAEHYGNVAGSEETAAAVNEIARNKARAALAAIATAGHEIRPPDKPCDPADPCSTAYDLASERDTLDGLLSETKDRLDAALAQVARLREAMAAIVARSENGELGTSRTRDMAGFARAALAETADTPAPAPSPADDGWTAWEGGECPMSHGLLVRVKCRDGEELQDSKPERWDWWNTGEGTDIVAYRIVGARDE